MSGEKNDKVTYLNMAKEAILAEKSRNGTSKQVSRQLFFWVEVTNLLTYTPLLPPSLTTGVTKYNKRYLIYIL